MTILPGDAVLTYRERIVAAHLQFADAAIEGLAQAEAVVAEAVAAIHQALLNDIAVLGAWRKVEQPDAAQLGVALREYQAYLDRLMSL